MIKVGIIGSSGYVAGELLRCLVRHPNVEIDFLYSHSFAGKKVSEIHTDLYEYENLIFQQKINPNVAIIFLCLGHGNSKQFLEKNTFSTQTKIIDLSNDFRLKKDANFQNKIFVYGLVELNKEKIKQSKYIANPGCFATAIQLALLPLAKENLIIDQVHTTAITGSTGAGQSLASTSHFSWRNNNVSIYKAFDHQHLAEISESIYGSEELKKNINFIPIRGNFTRGIFASNYTKCSLTEDEVFELYKKYYNDFSFVSITTQNIDLKQVINTNNCRIQIQKIDDKILITSIIDNLLKGAVGQAIQKYEPNVWIRR